MANHTKPKVTVLNFEDAFAKGVIRFDPNNSNRGTKRGHDLIAKSGGRLGALRSGVLGPDGTIIAGNQTAEVFAAEGVATEVVIIETKPHQWVMVKRPDLTPEQAQEAGIVDNRTSEIGLNWNPQQLLDDLNAGVELEEFFFDWELDTVLGKVSEVDPSEEWEGMPEFEQEAQSDFHFIAVRFETLGDMKAFSELIGQGVTNKTKSIYYPKSERGRASTYEADNDA